MQVFNYVYTSGTNTNTPHHTGNISPYIGLLRQFIPFASSMSLNMHDRTRHSLFVTATTQVASITEVSVEASAEASASAKVVAVWTRHCIGHTHIRRATVDGHWRLCGHRHRIPCITPVHAVISVHV